MRLLDFVEEDHRIGPSPNRFGQLTTFVIADISRRRANQASHGVLLHVLAHVDAHHGLLVIEQELSQRACGLRFANACGSQKDETSQWAAWDRSSPARERRIALATTVNAASWPTTRSRSRVSISTSFFTSPSSMRETGMPVHLLTMRGDVFLVHFFFQHARYTGLPSCAAFNCFSSASSLGNSPY